MGYGVKASDVAAIKAVTDLIPDAHGMNLAYVMSVFAMTKNNPL